MRKTVWEEPGAIDLLRELAAEGKSSGAISRELSLRFREDVSRNAVIGKLGRLHIELLGIPKGKAARERRKAGRPLIRLVPPPKKPVEIVRIEEPAPAGDVDTGCRWLHGDDPRARNFCGAELREASPYCQHHHTRCFNEVSAVKARRLEKFAKYACTRLS